MDLLVTTEACTCVLVKIMSINDEIMPDHDGVKKMEEINGKKFEILRTPLLVSVRSGAVLPMPGKDGYYP